MPNFNDFSEANLTGVPEVDGLFWSAYYTDQNIYYSFDYSSGPIDVPTSPFSETQIETVLNILADIEAVADITFVERDSDPTIEFANANLTILNAIGYATAPAPTGSYAYFQDYNYHVVAQEILHSLGLVGPNEGGALVSDTYPIDYQSSVYTLLMTQGHYSAEFAEYGNASEYPTGLQALDIEALQAVYGVSKDTAGNDKYYFDTSEFYFEGLFDAGGKDQIIIIDEARLGVEIDLNPRGGFNLGQSVFYGNHEVEETVHLTADTVIETVRLAGGDDFVQGNSASNTISGGDGDDTVHGNAGNDNIWAGPGDTGNDYFTGGSGNDVIGGGDGNDSLYGGTGIDTMYGSTGDDLLYAAPTNNHADLTDDVLYGGDGDDTVYGTDGNNVLGARHGDDFIYAFDGNDTVYASNGNDYVEAGGGADTIFAGQGDDTVLAGDGDDAIWTAGGNDYVTSGEGSDTIYIRADDGDKIISDFDPELDLIGLESANFSNLDALQANSTQVGNDLVIDLGSGSLTLEGISFSDLDVGNVLL